VLGGVFVERLDLPTGAFTHSAQSSASSQAATVDESPNVKLVVSVGDADADDAMMQIETAAAIVVVMAIRGMPPTGGETPPSGHRPSPGSQALQI
jgi:hypothetical protein